MGLAGLFVWLFKLFSRLFKFVRRLLTGKGEVERAALRGDHRQVCKI